MRKLTLLMLSFFVFAGTLLAQRTITGKVTDDKGNPLSNVSVVAKGTTIGTTTKADGSYTLTVPSNAKVLEFSSINMTPERADIGQSSIISVTLQSATKSMDEVIVTAYGTSKKGSFLGSAAQVDAEDLKNRTLSNPLNALVGAAPGIQTTTASGSPGSSPGIIMRGFGSYSLGNGPLYVVDGAVYEAGFSNLNIDDIETITALKDASATALYGSRASNGVILITTKKGKKGKQSIQFKAQLGTSKQAIPPYSTVNAFQYYPLAWESYRNGLVYGPTRTTIDSASRYASGLMPRYTTGSLAGQQIFRGNQGLQDIFQQLGGYNPFNVGNTAIVNPDGTINPAATLRYSDLDWLDEATRTGTRNEYSLSYTSGSDKADIAASFGYLKEKGWGLNSEIERFSGRVSVNVQATNWFKTGFNIAGNRSTFLNASTGGIVNPFYFARYIAPIYPVYAYDPATGEVLYDATGNKRYDFGNDFGYARPYNSGRHTIAENLWNKSNTIRDVLSSRAYAEFTFKPWLKFTTTIAADFRNDDSESYQNPIVGDGYPSGRYSRSTGKSQNYTFNQILNFNKRFGAHSIDALLGHENYSSRGIGTSGMRIGQSFDDVYVYSNFGTINSLTSSVSENRLEAYFSRINYEYRGKYLFSGSIRRDGSSRFPKDVRWYNFWSIAGGWKIDKEEFFKVSWIDALKLRASYGQVGNSNLDSDYPYQGGYSIGYDDDTRPGTVLTNLGSPQLTWESGNTFDVGIDYSMLKGRLRGTIGYFDRATSRLIYDVPQPLQNGGTTSGTFTVSENVGNMSNRGIEVQVAGTAIRKQDFTWDITVNATHFKNKITKMPVLTPVLTSSPFRREEGRSIYDFYTRTFYGVDPADGEALYLGVMQYNAATDRLVDNGKGGFDTVTIDHNNARQSYLGKSSIPDIYGSIQNSLSYKNFELNFTLTYQLGGYIYDAVYGSLMSTSINGTTYSTDILNRWQKPGDKTSVPRLDNLRTSQYGAASSRWLTKGTYLAVNNVSVAYNFPKSLLSRIGASGARFYISGENLHFFTKRKGMNVNGSFSGITGDTFDAARIINVGLTLSF